MISLLLSVQFSCQSVWCVVSPTFIVTQGDVSWSSWILVTIIITIIAKCYNFHLISMIMILKAPRAFGDSRTTFRGSFARPVDPASQGTGSTSSPASSSSPPPTSCLFFSRVSCLHIIVSIHRNRDPCHHHFVPIIVIVATLFALFDQHCHGHHCKALLW